MLPPEEAPEYTEGYEGFFHLIEMTGTVEESRLSYLIRDFDSESYANRKRLMQDIAAAINEKYGDGTVELILKDSYRNMREKIEPVHYIIDIAKQAMQELNIKPLIVPIRGGTDGARLSFMGLPTPNLFTGGHNFHGRYEYIPVYAMEKAVQLIIRIAELCTKI